VRIQVGCMAAPFTILWMPYEFKFRIVNGNACPRQVSRQKQKIERFWREASLRAFSNCFYLKLIKRTEAKRATRKLKIKIWHILTSRRAFSFAAHFKKICVIKKVIISNLLFDGISVIINIFSFSRFKKLFQKSTFASVDESRKNSFVSKNWD